jgi:hypothetical protein
MGYSFAPSMLPARDDTSAVSARHGASYLNRLADSPPHHCQPSAEEKPTKKPTNKKHPVSGSSAGEGLTPKVILGLNCRRCKSPPTLPAGGTRNKPRPVS